jgi:hypothetical protein
LGDQWYGNLGMSEDDLFARLRVFYGSMFADAAAARGKTRWGDKTPFHVRYLQLAARVFPDCRIVGIVRHLGAVTASLRKRFRYDATRATNHWERTTKQPVMAAMELGERCAVIRYEDLVSAPEPVLRTVLEHVGEPWSPAVLAHHEIQAVDGVSLESQGFTRIDQPLDPGRLSDWETRLGHDVRRELAAVAPLASFLGYDAAQTFPLAELTNPQQPLVTSRDLTARRRAVPTGVDWEHWPVPTRGNAPLLSNDQVVVALTATRPHPPPQPRQSSSRGIATRVRRRLSGVARQTLPQSARRRIHQARRNHPAIDRVVGPR